MLAPNRNYAAPESVYTKRSLHGTTVWISDIAPEEKLCARTRDLVEAMETQNFIREDCSTAQTLTLERETVDREVSDRRMVNSSSLHRVQEEPLRHPFDLGNQWGTFRRKRSRRRPNPKPKVYNSFHESTEQNSQAATDPSVIFNSSAAVLGGNTISKKRIARKKDCAFLNPLMAAEYADLEADHKREKRLKNTDSKDEKISLHGQACQRDSSQVSQQVDNQQKFLPTTRSSLGKKVASSDECSAAIDNGLKATQPGKDLPFPKIVLSLSRKEIEEDFLLLKGTKLPKRPQRRPRVAETAALMCTPGIVLSEITLTRYNVRGKKSITEKPRGLKAM